MGGGYPSHFSGRGGGGAQDLLIVSAKDLKKEWEPLKKLKMSVHGADLLLSGLIQQQLNLKGTKL